MYKISQTNVTSQMKCCIQAVSWVGLFLLFSVTSYGQDCPPYHQLYQLRENEWSWNSILNFENVKTPTWRNSEEFARALVSRDHGEGISKLIFLYIEEHPDSFPWVLTTMLEVLESRPDLNNYVADTIAELRGFYLRPSRYDEFEKILNEFYIRRAKEIEKLSPNIKEAMSRAISRLPDLTIGIEPSDRASHYVAILAIALDAAIDLQKQNSQLEDQIALMNSAIDRLNGDQEEVRRFLYFYEDDRARKEAGERLSELEIPDDSKARALEFLNRISSATPRIQLRPTDNPWLNLFAAARIRRENVGEGEGSDQFSDHFYLRLLNRLEGLEQLDPSVKTFLHNEKELTEQTLQQRYGMLYRVVELRDRMLGGNEPLSEESDDFETFADTVGGEYEAGYFITWAWGVALLIDEKAPQWMVDFLEDMIDRQENPFAVPYIPLSGVHSFETERGAAARAPIVFYALYNRAKDPIKKEKWRNFLVESLHRNFASYMGSLTVRARRWPFMGNHELKDWELPSGYPNDGLAPYYFYPTVPWLVDAIKALKEDQNLTSEQRTKVQLFQEQLRTTLLASLSDEGFFIPEGQLIQTAAYSQAFGMQAYLNLIRLIE